MYFSRVRVSTNITELSRLNHVLRGNGYGVHQLLWDLFPDEKERPFLFREEIAGEQLPHHKGVRGEPIYYVVSQREPIKGNPLFMVDSKTYSPKLAAGDRMSFKLRANPTVARKEAGKKNSVRHDIVMDAQYHFLRELAWDAGLVDAGKKSDLKNRILAAWLASKNPAITTKLERVLEGNERYQDYVGHKLDPAKQFDLAMKASTDSALEKWLTERSSKNGFIMVRDEKRNLAKFQSESYRWHALPKKGKSAGFSSVDFEGEIKVTNPTLFVNVLFNGIGPAKSFGCGLMLVKRI